MVSSKLSSLRASCVEPAGFKPWQLTSRCSFLPEARNSSANLCTDSMFSRSNCTRTVKHASDHTAVWLPATTGGSRPKYFGGLASPFSCPTLPFFSFPPLFPFLPLEVGPLITARRSGERCILPQRGLGRSPHGNRILCSLAIKSGIKFTDFSENQLTSVSRVQG